MKGLDMRKRVHMLLVALVFTIASIVVWNLQVSPAYRGIDSLVCRELAKQFSISPALLRYDDLEQLGDCVSFYKRVYSVMPRDHSGGSRTMKGIQK
jgi:hypothetical protein